MGKVYIDVTQLVHWQGMVTGIPRVMDKLSRRFAKDDSVQFVSWVKDRQELCLVDFKATMRNKDNGTGGLVYIKRRDSSQDADQRVEYRAKLKTLAKKAAKKIGANRFAAIDKLKGIAAHAEALEYLPIPIEKGDKLLIPWGEWWDPSFTRKLVEYNESGLELVQIVHDVGPIIWPQFFEKVEVNFEDYLMTIVPISSLVLSVSKNTKQELIQLLEKHSLTPPQIEVFRLGEEILAKKPTKPIDEAFVASKLKGDDYLLCVATIEAKKNHALFYYTYKLAASQGIDLPKLVTVGRKGWNTDNIIDIMSRDPEVKDKFVFTTQISDEELSWLFDNCLCTVQPSFHEGWGIPIAESIARGIPCICSNTSSMVEIAEDYVTHFSPLRPDECLQAIQDMLKPEVLARRKQEIKKYKPTLWDDTYRQVRQYIEEI